MKRRARVLVSGKVQGVFFRVQTHTKAQELGLTGFVRNLADGRVEAVVEGEENGVQELIAWCRRGPREARVDRIELQWEDFQDEFDEFSIRRG